MRIEQGLKWLHVMVLSGLCAARCVAPAIATEPAAKPAPDVPELQLLAKYVGRWTGELIRQGEDQRRRTRATTDWAVGGRYLRTEYSGDGLQGMIITTYDARGKEFRRWQFDAGGDVTEYTGRFDKESDTFRFEHHNQEQGYRIVTESRFDEQQVEQWRMVVKDRDGQVLQEYRGTNRRETGR